MRSLISRRTFCSIPKDELPPIYPAINIYTKELIIYPPKYVNLVKKCVEVKTPKKHNIFYDALPEFLEKQKQDDKTHLVVPKEIIFLGRSNVGKSSLLNALFKQKIGNVSKNPGTTKMLIFHEIFGGKAFAVDAPGYGFADINLKMRKKWLKLIRTYLSKSSRLCRAYVLINMEHGIKDTDFEFLEFVNGHNHPIQVVLTKSDKVKENELFDRSTAIGHQLKQFNMVSPVLHICSSKKNFGLDLLRQSLASSIEDYHSKFELDHLKYKLHLEQIEGAKKEVQNPNLPPPEEMYKLLIKQGNKPSQ